MSVVVEDVGLRGDHQCAHAHVDLAGEVRMCRIDPRVEIADERALPMSIVEQPRIRGANHPHVPLKCGKELGAALVIGRARGSALRDSRRRRFFRGGAQRLGWHPLHHAILQHLDHIGLLRKRLRGCVGEAARDDDSGAFVRAGDGAAERADARDDVGGGAAVAEGDEPTRGADARETRCGGVRATCVRTRGEWCLFGTGGKRDGERADNEHVRRRTTCDRHEKPQGNKCIRYSMRAEFSQVALCRHRSQRETRTVGHC